MTFSIKLCFSRFMTGN
ncbi:MULTISPECIES: peptide IlvX [Klebsiella pneumoniae complex]|nr:peptide IlvX [Klebsiella pneumoniae]